MKLEAELDEKSLAALGAEAVDLLCRGDIGSLVRKYGYALSCDREAESAVREDVNRCLSDLRADSLAPAPENPVQAVRFYPPNSSNIVAVIECLAPTDNGTAVRLELVVTRKGTEDHITIEDVSVV
jgi:hypothetical protein